MKIIINFSDLRIFPIFVIFIFKLDANLTIFFDFIYLFSFMRQKNTLISAISWEFDN